MAAGSRSSPICSKVRFRHISSHHRRRQKSKKGARRCLFFPFLWAAEKEGEIFLKRKGGQEQCGRDQAVKVGNSGELSPLFLQVPDGCPNNSSSGGLGTPFAKKDFFLPQKIIKTRTAAGTARLGLLLWPGILSQRWEKNNRFCFRGCVFCEDSAVYITHPQGSS